ncbi:hypothetical protein D0Y65_006763 [Glycine soja]|uniref:Uncharacterized protein n=1 Tax=Glycine soja TaxID=3848 RepID=A0A445LAB4_GLYSO|nr:hypothetical protein D0Y65_006763 [Glycine soja]
MLFLLSSPKTLSFSRRPPNLSQKNDDPGLAHRWIVVKFEHHVRNPITKRNTPRIVAFSFPAETQSYLGTKHQSHQYYLEKAEKARRQRLSSSSASAKSAQARQGYDEEADVINPNPLEALLDFCHLALF